MGTVFKKTYTKPLRAAAETFTRKGERFARWKDAKNKTQTAPLTTGKDGSDRIVVKAGTYTAKYRDGSGVVIEKATGCRDETAARSVLAELERRAELVKAKVMTVAEDNISDHQGVPLADHFEAYLTKLEADGTSPDHRGNVRRCLERITADCRFSTLGDLKREAFERWLVQMMKVDMGARTRNLHRASLVAFSNWCVVTDRLIGNPFAKVEKADENTDRRRQRRAMTEAELVKLLDVARRRPLLDAMTIRRGKRKGQAVAKVRDETRDRLELLGRERALIYKTLVLTGLRKGELASLTVRQLMLDGPMPYVVLDAADEKNREGSTIPLRADLAADLRGWLTEKVRALQEAHTDAPTIRLDSQRQEPGKLNQSDATRSEGQVCLGLTRLPSDTPLFIVPRDLVRILDRDLKLAGIPKVDERGRTIDVHALRHSFGTLLSKGGVAPRTAQAAMRHSSIDLTMNTYTDPKLLDVAGAMEALPALPLDGAPNSERVVARATGTDDRLAAALAPVLAPKSDKPSKLGSIRDTGQTNRPDQPIATAIDASAYPVKRKKPLTTIVNGFLQERETGFGPATSSLGS